MTDGMMAHQYFGARCVACGDHIDYCQGHGTIGDPAGSAVLARHDKGDHTDCHPAGCDDAREARFDPYIPGTQEGD